MIIILGAGAISFIEFLQIIVDISSEVDESIKEAFEIFDRDGNGVIAVDEFTLMMQTLGAQLNDEEVNEIIREIDLDGDGKINLHGMMNLLHS